MKLLTVDNVKTIKGESLGWLTGILYLAPAFIADVKRSVCPYASPGCTTACLYSAGRGCMSTVQRARIRKTREFWSNRQAFIDTLRHDIDALARRAERQGMRAAVRLNGTSDLEFWRWLPMDEHSVQFYDYTKNFHRVAEYSAARKAYSAGPPFRATGNPAFPVNYHLTFSRSETNHAECVTVLRHGINVAAVFRNAPDKFEGYTVVNGDAHDLRFLDQESPAWVALTAKGDARRDTSGFVIVGGGAP